MRGTNRDTDGDAGDGSADRAFESELEELLLRAFGQGKEVEGVWDLEYEPEELPDWTVTIDRRDRI